MVDDDPGLRLVVVRSLERVGFKCRQAEDAASALDIMNREQFDLVISDIGDYVD